MSTPKPHQTKTTVTADRFRRGGSSRQAAWGSPLEEVLGVHGSIGRGTLFSMNQGRRGAKSPDGRRTWWSPAMSNVEMKFFASVQVVDVLSVSPPMTTGTSARNPTPRREARRAARGPRGVRMACVRACESCKFELYWMRDRSVRCEGLITPETFSNRGAEIVSMRLRNFRTVEDRCSNSRLVRRGSFVASTFAMTLGVLRCFLSRLHILKKSPSGQKCFLWYIRCSGRQLCPRLTRYSVVCLLCCASFAVLRRPASHRSRNPLLLPLPAIISLFPINVSVFLCLGSQQWIRRMPMLNGIADFLFPGSAELMNMIIHPISAIPLIPLVVGGAGLALLVELVLLDLHAKGAVAECARVFGFETGEVLWEIFPDEVLGALGTGAWEEDLAAHGWW